MTGASYGELGSPQPAVLLPPARIDVSTLFYARVAMATDVDTVLAKWARNTTGAVDSYKEGVMAVKEAPTAKAAAAAQKYADNVRKAVDEGRFQEALLAVGLGDWQSACTDKGSRRISDGVKQATPKFRSFLDQSLPYTANLKAEVRRMPKTNEAEADARLMHAVNKMRQFRFRKRRGT